MKTIKALLILIVLISFQYFSFGQLVVNSTMTAAQLVQNVLLGPGINAFNITSNAGGTTACIGEFSNGNTTNLGITAGVVMSSGLITDISQDNGSFASTDIGLGSDPELANIAGAAVEDAVTLQFDFIPLSPTVTFRYVFGSEEYPEFVGAGYNDAFGFFISGPNPGGGNYSNVNLALIPSTTTPVSIDNVNATTNSGYFTTNGAATIVFDGFTHVLVATCQVTPCMTYHIKLAVGDAGDGVYDSGIFLEAGSFSGGNSFSLGSNPSNPGLSNNAIENCSDATVSFTMASAQAAATVINFTVDGTATNGVDYTAIPTSVTIPAGSTTASLVIHSLQDAFIEGNETVRLIVATPPCGFDTIVVIIEDNPPFTVVTTPNTSVCDNDQLNLTATVNGGLPPYTYVWSNGTTTAANTVYPTGIGTTVNYVVSATDVCLDQATATTSVGVNNCTPCATYAGIDAKICSLSYVLEATTQAGDHNMAWSSSVAGVTFSSISSPTATVTVPTAGTYSFVWSVTNITNLTCTDTVRIIFSPTPTSTFTAISPACLGDSVLVTYNGTASVGAIYSWNYGGGTGIASGVGPHNVYFGGQGNYTISLSVNDDGCLSNSTTQAVNVPPVLDYSVTSGTVFCNGGSTGNAIQPIAIGGTPLYTYTYSNCNCATPPTTMGTYQTTVTDTHGCTDTTSFVITQPNPIVVQPNQTNLNCNADGTGNASVVVSGGTPPYNYAWSNNIVLNSASQNSMQAGPYTVSIVDANGCPVNQLITLTQPPALVASQDSIVPVKCFGGNNGAFYASAIGGTNPLGYALSGLPQPTGAFTALSAGNYTVTVIDAHTCTVTLPFTITQPTQVTVSSPTTTNIPCFGQHNGTLSVTGAGGTTPLSYSIGGAGQATGNFTGLYPGSYSVTVTDGNGCIASSASGTIVQPNVLALNPVTSTNLVCNNSCIGTITVTATGGTNPLVYAYTGVSQPTGNFANLCAGTYNITVTDANGCPVTANPVIITEPTALVISSQNATSIPCFGNRATINVIANGGTSPISYNYGSGSSPSGTFIGLQGGLYTVTVTDGNGCFIMSNNFNIVEPPLLAIIDSAFLDITCFGAADGKIQAVATGGTPQLRYSIMPGLFQNTNAFVGLNVGTYSLTVTDARGCTDVTTFTLTQPDLLIADATSTNVRCYGETNGTADVVYSGGTAPYQVLWSNAATTNSLPNIGMGTYFVVVKDAHNCSVSDTVTVTQPLKIHVTASNDTMICKNDQTMLVANATGGTSPFTYLWNGIPGMNVFTPHLAKDSVIYVSATDINGCKGDTARISVHVFPDVYLKVYADDTTVCVGSTVNLSFQASGGSGNAYLLYDENGVIDFPYTLNPNYTKTYYFRAYDNVCPTPGTDTITIYTIPLPNATFFPDPNKGCQPLTVNFSLVTDVACNTFLWNFGEENAISYSHSPQHVYVTSGIFDVTVTFTSDSGCVNSVTRPQIIEVYPKPDSRFDYSPAVVSIIEPEVNFINFSTGATLNIWSFGDGDTSWTLNPTHVYNQVRSYNVQLAVESNHGCKDTSKAVIVVKDEVTVYIPTAFSPDNDGVNDLFKVMAHGLDKQTFVLIIYDRWGEPIYESHNIDEGWNGSIKKGGKGTSDTYVWMMSFKDPSGKKYQRTGNVTLIR